MSRQMVLIAALLALLGVALGAFGAHGLEPILQQHARQDTFHTANQYHMIHALAILLTAALYPSYPHRAMRWASYAFLAGIFLFSGSLYMLAVFDLRVMGAVAPLGGTAFIIGWGCIAWTAYRSTEALSHG